MKFHKTLAIVATLACASAASAQGYPTRPITMVVPAPAGGATDAIARALATEMGQQLKQPIVVDNKPGATGMLGTQAVARAAPDGYTLLMTVSAPILNAPYLFQKVPYDVSRDLAFISQVCTAAMVLAVGKDVPATTMKEFTAWAEKNKGKVSYGSFGIGGAGHLVSAYLNETRKLDMNHVAYKGEAPMVQDIISGQIPWGVGSVGTLAPHIASGKVRALAVFGDHRLKELPNVPTMAEAGFPEPEYRPMGWMVMMAPANTPAPVLARLEEVTRAATQSDSVKARFQFFGFEAVGSSAEQFRREYEAARPVAQKLIQISGAKAE
ncbi:tripartite tricarboxylate transporter substrate binding protein [Variovorax robiniae]|uniref:Tripartite tricarboxylate transporter substrate binding protein n=1 Tax=Variovorax robiniae TaxID=1836199 RepID=A0ABU8X8X1_9BURK